MLQRFKVVQHVEEALSGGSRLLLKFSKLSCAETKWRWLKGFSRLFFLGAIFNSLCPGSSQRRSCGSWSQQLDSPWPKRKDRLWSIVHAENCDSRLYCAICNTLLLCFENNGRHCRPCGEWMRRLWFQSESSGLASKRARIKHSGFFWRLWKMHLWTDHRSSNKAQSRGVCS